LLEGVIFDRVDSISDCILLSMSTVEFTVGEVLVMLEVYEENVK
jgi:hypothetical protein